MTLVDRFDAYAADFERTFADDDCSRLAQYFTEDAVYSTPANGLRVVGREKMLATLRAAVSGFDRRCETRSLTSIVGPREEGSEVFRRWLGKFTVAGAPDLEIEGSERAKFRGERIELLEVALTQETLAQLMNYAAKYVASRGHYHE